MLWTDLEVGDELVLVSLNGEDIIDACSCTVCSFYRQNIGEVIKIIGVYENNGKSIKVYLKGKNLTQINKTFSNDLKHDNFKIHSLKDD